LSPFGTKQRNNPNSTTKRCPQKEQPKRIQTTYGQKKRQSDKNKKRVTGFSSSPPLDPKTKTKQKPIQKKQKTQGSKKNGLPHTAP
jgi:hypothetical protein